jgi:DNA-binding NtrC family response regulator
MTLDRRPRVLIADADAGLRRGLNQRLADAEVSADIVSEGKEAIEKLNASSYAVVVLDLGLPQAGAERILDLIGATPKERRPVVLVTATPGAARSLDVDVVQIVLRKPCDLAQLSEIVESCVRCTDTASSNA